MQPERLASLVLWLVLLATAILFAPPAAPDTTKVIFGMVTGQLDGVNTSLFALFNLMGVFPMAFLAVLALDSTEQRVPKWPFLVLSFGLGAYVLLPYLVMRRWNLPRRAASTWWLRLLGSRLVGGVLTLLALTLVSLFVVGDVRAFMELFRTEQFPFAMSLDFIACCVAAALLGREEATLRGQRALQWLALVPGAGLPLVLLFRRGETRADVQ
ncbi:MAG: hypothetical protein Q8S33_02170 [Myxococcales bacterium]|nr:hypothetical protein [Myxococcales bacterium]